MAGFRWAVSCRARTASCTARRIATACTSAGTIFRVTLDGHITTLYGFRGETDGAFPQTALVEGRDGDFYGTAFQQLNRLNTGTVFRMTGDVTSRHSAEFLQRFRCQARVTNTLIQGADGNFYGTTVHGGSSGVGTVFNMTPDGTLTRLHALPGSAGRPSVTSGPGERRELLRHD